MRHVTEKWDSARVKAELPDVPVQIDGEVFTGVVRGRLLNFAKVAVQITHPGASKPCEMHELPSFDVAWSTIAHVLNSVDAGVPAAVRY